MKNKTMVAPIRLTATLLTACMLLTGCVNGAFETKENASVTLPVPSTVPQEAPYGDEMRTQNRKVVLYYVTADSTALEPVTRTIAVSGEKSLCRSVVEELLKPSKRTDLVSVAPSDTRVINVEQSGGTVTVNLSLDAMNVQSQQEILWMHSAITATLIALDGVDSVNVLVGGRKVSVDSMPIGAGTQAETALTTLWAQYQAEEERMLADSDAQSCVIDRNVYVYYPAKGQNYYLPEMKAIRFTRGDYVTPLVKALVAQPDRSDCAQTIFSAEMQPDFEWRVDVNDLGQRVLTLNFLEMNESLADFDRISASFTLTLTSFVPEIDAVDVTIGGKRPAAKGRSADGLFYRQTYATQIGAIASLRMKNENGSGLVILPRVVPAGCDQEPRLLLEQVFAGPGKNETGVQSVMPEGINREDILGIAFGEGIMEVNLSANFYRLCQKLSVDEERCVVYAMVNTLCSISGVNAVRFFVEGNGVETLSEGISLQSPLLYNPGLEQSESTQAET